MKRYIISGQSPVMKWTRRLRDSHTARLDGVAVAMSFVCILHCLMTPVLATLFPILAGTMLENHQFHAFLLIFVIPTSILALYLGCRRHRDGLVLSLGVAGMSLLGIVAVLGPETLSVPGEKIATGIGGVILASAHLLNYRRCRALKCEESDCEHFTEA